MAERGLYEVLGLTPTATDAELRAAYRRLAQRHHPDHNGGSAQAARRFEAIHHAYITILAERRSSAAAESAPAAGDLDARLAALERELQKARAAQEAARHSARQAAQETERRPGTAGSAEPRPTDEELGYYTTEDSFTQILDDAAAELGRRLGRLGGSDR
jgi:DnaJ-class molecular chaperone